MRTFHALAALMALLMIWRHGRAALGLFAPRGAAAPAGRAAALAPLLTCLVAAAVLALAVRGLLLGPPSPGGTP